MFLISTKLHAWAIVITIGATSTFPGALHAAEISKVDATTKYDCEIILEGEIQRGDAEKIAALNPRWGSVVCLDSEGGSFPEGIKIAELFTKNAVATKVTSEASCLSACAIAFMGGTFDTESGEGYLPWRFLEPGAILGFHAPSLEVKKGSYSEQTVLDAYSVTLKSISMIINKRNSLVMSQDLIARMLERGKNDFYYIDTIDKAGRFSIGLSNYEIPSKAANGHNSCWNMYAWKNEMLTGEFADGYDSYATYLSEESKEKRINKQKEIFSSIDIGGEGYANCRIVLGTRENEDGFNQIVDEYYELGWENASKEGDFAFQSPLWSRLPPDFLIKDLAQGSFSDYRYRWSPKFLRNFKVE